MRTAHPSIAIFQADWPLQSQTVNLIRCFVARDWRVDLYFYGVSTKLEQVSDRTGKVRTFDLTGTGANQASPKSPPTGKGLMGRIARRLVGLRLYSRSADATVRQIWKIVPDLTAKRYITKILPSGIIESAATLACEGRYSAVVGVESLGLIWAGAVVERCKTQIPVIYYSLELYTWDHPSRSGGHNALLKRLEGYYHRRSSVTVVQDADRAEILLQDNRVKDTEVLYLPVSLLGDRVRHKGKYLHEMLGIDLNERVILVFGKIHRRRFSAEVVQASQALPPGWTVVLHGELSGGGEHLSDYLKRLDANSRVVISTQIVPSEEIEKLVASSDIGLVLYSDKTKNDYLTGRSSEKVAQYARAGIPMIAFNYPSFSSVFATYHCGICVDTLDDLDAAVGRIMSRYEAYRAGAWNAYVEVYEFSRHFESLGRWIDSHRHS